jgi:hypothetical protein
MDSFPQALRYFHAAFNLKELAGNAIPGYSISRNSQGQYASILPQDLEINSQLSSAIRDADLLALLQADLALFKASMGRRLIQAPLSCLLSRNSPISPR